MQAKLEEELHRLHRMGVEIDSTNLEYWAGYVQAIIDIKKVFGIETAIFTDEELGLD